MIFHDYDSSRICLNIFDLFEVEVGMIVHHLLCIM